MLVFQLATVHVNAAVRLQIHILEITDSKFPRNTVCPGCSMVFLGITKEKL